MVMAAQFINCTKVNELLNPLDGIKTKAALTGSKCASRPQEKQNENAAGQKVNRVARRVRDSQIGAERREGAQRRRGPMGVSGASLSAPRATLSLSL